jgi:membrane protease YdiL (CAAX protease family)
MRPEPGARIPWAVVFMPLVLQYAATILLSVLLQPPSDTAQQVYSIRFGLVLLFSYAVLVGATVLIADRAGDVRQVLALRPVAPLRAIAYALAGLVAAFLAARLLEPVFHGIRAQGFEPDPFPGGNYHAASLALVAVGFAVAAPIAEELYFRGLVFGRGAAHGPVVAVVVQAVVFGAAHLTLDAFPVLTLYGLVFGLLRLWTRSIIPGALAHGLNNGLALAFAVAAA